MKKTIIILFLVSFKPTLCSPAVVDFYLNDKVLTSGKVFVVYSQQIEEYIITDTLTTINFDTVAPIAVILNYNEKFYLHSSIPIHILYFDRIRFEFSVEKGFFSRTISCMISFPSYNEMVVFGYISRFKTNLKCKRLLKHKSC